MPDLVEEIARLLAEADGKVRDFPSARRFLAEWLTSRTATRFGPVKIYLPIARIPEGGYHAMNETAYSTQEGAKAALQHFIESNHGDATRNWVQLHFDVLELELDPRLPGSHP